MAGSILMLAALAISVLSCKEKPKTASQGGSRKAGPVNVEVTVIRPDTLANVIYATGTILPNEKVELRNEVPGRVTGIYFDEGTEVQEGTLLLRINDEDLQAQLNKNAVQEKMAQEEEFRKKNLLNIRAISQEEYDLVANQLESVKAENQILEAQVAKTRIYAPFGGKIGLRNVSPGSYLPSNTVIATLQQVDPVKIEFAVPEKYSKEVRPGMEIRFSMDYSPESYKGRIYAVESGVDEATRTIKVRATCPNPGRNLIPGTFTRISILLEEIKDAIKVPSESVIGDISGNKVFIVSNGKAKSVPIKTGIRTESDIQVIDGLQPGDSLILTGLLQINDGSPLLIKIRQPAAAGSDNQ
jgi:membrane fusion protein (multidrug efflux system)